MGEERVNLRGDQGNGVGRQREEDACANHEKRDCPHIRNTGAGVSPESFVVFIPISVPNMDEHEGVVFK